MGDLWLHSLMHFLWKRSPKVLPSKTGDNWQSSNDDEVFHDAESPLPSNKGRPMSV